MTDGTPSTPPDRRTKILRGFDLATSRGIEFGPLGSPLVRKDQGDITYVDHLDQAALRKKYADAAPVDTAAIVRVDVVCDGQTFREAMAGAEPYDYVVASHVVEHVPDLICWFADLYDTDFEVLGSRALIP